MLTTVAMCTGLYWNVAGDPCTAATIAISSTGPPLDINHTKYFSETHGSYCMCKFDCFLILLVVLGVLAAEVRNTAAAQSLATTYGTHLTAAALIDR